MENFSSNTTLLQLLQAGAKISIYHSGCLSGLLRSDLQYQNIDVGCSLEGQENWDGFYDMSPDGLDQALRAVGK